MFDRPCRSAMSSTPLVTVIIPAHNLLPRNPLGGADAPAPLATPHPSRC